MLKHCCILEPFQLCTPFDGSKQEDVAYFMFSLVSIAMYAVQFDFELKGYGFNFCESMINKKNGNSSIERLANLNKR